MSVSRKYGLTFNIKKTQYMFVAKAKVPNAHLYVGGEMLERVDRVLETPWIGHVTNGEVLRRMKKDLEILQEVRRREKLWVKYRLEGEEYPDVETCENGLMSRYLTYLRRQLQKLK
ncbi:hypothetical protein Trydic_g23677 [Trypoxylus dichotomus]